MHHEVAESMQTLDNHAPTLQAMHGKKTARIASESQEPLLWLRVVVEHTATSECNPVLLARGADLARLACILLRKPNKDDNDDLIDYWAIQVGSRQCHAGRAQAKQLLTDRNSQMTGLLNTDLSPSALI
jgi:hypothetical protein